MTDFAALEAALTPADPYGWPPGHPLGIFVSLTDQAAKQRAAGTANAANPYYPNIRCAAPECRKRAVESFWFCSPACRTRYEVAWSPPESP